MFKLVSLNNELLTYQCLQSPTIFTARSEQPEAQHLFEGFLVIIGTVVEEEEAAEEESIFLIKKSCRLIEVLGG